MIKRVPILEGDLDDHQVGSDDVLTGISTSTSILVGDAGQNILDHAVGATIRSRSSRLSLTFATRPLATPASTSPTTAQEAMTHSA